MSPKHIEELLAGGGRYDLDVLQQMEAYLEEQLEKGSYDLEANLAILKIYLLYPDSAKVPVYEGILLKALMAFPSTDFALCMYQIPEKHQQGLEHAMELARLLETAKFKAFWKTAQQQIDAAKEKETEGGEVQGLSRAQGWQTAVRKFVAGVVSSTYRSIRCDQLADLLNLQVSELAPLIQENNWVKSKEDKDVIIVRENASFETARAEPKERATMSLDMYRQLFMASSSGA
jgi:translation initiation factor 3 subunit K